MEKNMISMILAMDLEGGIGKDGTLPWHYSEDLKRFKTLTKDSVVVMGKKTWNDPKFPKPLKDRLTFVFARDRDTVIEPQHIDGILECDPIEMPRIIASLKDIGKPVWVIGGATLYNEMLPYVDKVHLTLINNTHQCDTFFDTEKLYDNFMLVRENNFEDYSFLTYSKVK
jgi:dihydrofolate reductase